MSLNLPSRRARARRAAPRAGFTLIEMIAVVAIIAMVFAIGIPRLGSSSWDPLESEAESIAESLRFARQRAIMTGVPHRLLIDLEEGGYRIQWLVSEERALSAVGEEGQGAFSFGGALSNAGSGLSDDVGAAAGGPAIDLVPPRVKQLDYFPIPNSRLGKYHWLDDALYFVGVDGASGWVEGGDYPIVFYVDGTTDAARLEIADANDKHLTLEIEPILERVHVRAGGARS